jgi:SAM-dependent methyltransferase
MVLGNFYRSSYSKRIIFTLTVAALFCYRSSKSSIEEGITLAKTYRKIQQWDHWLNHASGAHVLDAEQKFLPHLISQYYGKHALLIGTPKQQVLLKASVMPIQHLLSPLPSHHHVKNMGSIESDLVELPLASGSVDMVILPHMLEYLDNPRQLLSEACRIVKPEGHIIICGFNPFSFWGLRKLFARHKNIPWSGSFIAPTQIKSWLGLADFKLVRQSMILFRPPITNAKVYKRLKFLEWLGKKCFAPLGGVYVLVAQAKVIPLTPIKLRWKQQLSNVRLPRTIGVPGPSIRNHPK